MGGWDGRQAVGSTATGGCRIDKPMTWRSHRLESRRQWARRLMLGIQAPHQNKAPISVVLWAIMFSKMRPVNYDWRDFSGPSLFSAGRIRSICPNVPWKGNRIAQEMLKMKEPPGMYMKTNDVTTICPTQKATFLPGCTPIYTEIHIFWAYCRFLCHNLRAAERNCRFKMKRLDKGRTPFGPTPPRDVCWKSTRENKH